MSENQTSRRDFLRASVLTSALFGAERALTGAEGRKVAANGGEARNVILMVSDGMNHGALSLARQYQGLVVQEESNWMRLYRERPVVRCLAETFSANSCVTDSAAAASAWGGGRRVNNGVLNMLPEGGEVVPLHAKLQKAGKKTGLVTTATITHATPAGFAANVDSRADEGVIAQQYLDRRVDVLLGGGQKFFSEA
jgi:alkaline phosphatase